MYSLRVLSKICECSIGSTKPDDYMYATSCSWLTRNRQHMTCDLVKQPIPLMQLPDIFREIPSLTIMQERPCARCIKRNIGHLCHDEPREPESAAKRSKSHHSNSAEEEDTSVDRTTENGASPFDQRQDRLSDTNLALGGNSLNQVNTGDNLQLVQPTPVSGIQAGALNSNINDCRYFENLI